MGFHKRHFSSELIKSNAIANEYETFKRYMTSPDACIFQDNKSSEIWNNFVSGNEETRKEIYKKLRNEA
jgi:hypothetical protein